MDNRVIRSIEEIDEQIKWGRVFSEKHPMSAYGNDNESDFNACKDILERVKQGEMLSSIECQLNDELDDGFIGEEDFFNRTEVLYWLESADAYPIYSEVDV